jgi:hypothetical protein
VSHRIRTGSGFSVAGQDYERVDVEVERMIHVGVVDHLPDLDRAKLRVEVDAFVFEGLAVNEEPDWPLAHLLGKDDPSSLVDVVRVVGRK